MEFITLNKTNFFRNILDYLNDQSIDIRIRMMFFLEYVSLIACSIGTMGMILLHQTIESMIPNFILFIMSFLGLYLSHVRKKYDLSATVMVLGCANLALPWMYFAAGGNESGMLSWFMFGVIVTCMMTKGRIRIIMSAVTIAEDIACICIGHYAPDTVKPLTGDNAVFSDQLQSYAVACIFLAIMLIIYINTYEKQKEKLEQQSAELRHINYTDTLTGLFNRRAYYEEINSCINGKTEKDLVIAAFDVNGLKKVNDMEGHSAGDDYICSAAKAITRAFGQYGKIFRTGGDEFMAVLHCPVNDTCCFEERLNKSIASPENTWAGKMTIAMGTVCCAEHPDTDLTGLEKLADERMYENKAAYYRLSGADRRK